MVSQVDVFPFAILALEVPHVTVALLWLQNSSCTNQRPSPCAEGALVFGENLAIRVESGFEDEEVRVIHKA